MSCKCNGAPMCEGRHEYAIMPSVVRCDHRHARTDNRPLTREQIAAMPGVRCPLKFAARNQRRLTDDERAGILRDYAPGKKITGMVAKYRACSSSIIQFLKQAGVYVSSREGRISKKKDES